MDWNLRSRHGETPLGRAIWFPRTAPTRSERQQTTLAKSLNVPLFLATIGQQIYQMAGPPGWAARMAPQS
jgi:hypothetical protein